MYIPEKLDPRIEYSEHELKLFYLSKLIKKAKELIRKEK